MHDLSIRKVPGVGRVNERLLEALGIKTCGDIFKHRATLQLMDKQFGLVFLLRTHLGVASNVVQPIQREERKSIGAERTFHALSNKTQILRKLEEVAGELGDDMVREGWTGKTVTLKFKLDTFQVFTRAKSFDRWVSSNKEDLFAIGKELLLLELPLTLRLIGLRVTKLKDLHALEPTGGIKRILDCSSSLNLQIRHQERDRDLLTMRKIATMKKTTLEKIMNRCRGSMKKKMQKGKVSMLPMMRSRLRSLMMQNLHTMNDEHDHQRQLQGPHGLG